MQGGETEGEGGRCSLQLRTHSRGAAAMVGKNAGRKQEWRQGPSTHPDMRLQWEGSKRSGACSAVDEARRGTKALATRNVIAST